MENTCAAYRTEMMLVGLRLHLKDEQCREEDKEDLLSQIQAMEKALGID